MYSYYINLALYNPSANHKTLWLNSWRKKRDILTSNVLSFLSNVYTKIGEKEIWNNYTVQFNIPYPFIHLHPSILIFLIHSYIHTNIPYPFIHLHSSILIFLIHSFIFIHPYQYSLSIHPSILIFLIHISFILLICIHSS